MFTLHSLFIINKMKDVNIMEVKFNQMLILHIHKYAQKKKILSGGDRIK